MRGVSGLLISLALAVAGAAAAHEPPPIVTRHQIHLPGRTMTYLAETGRIPIPDERTGEAHGEMFYVAYRVASPNRRRPVTFVWNGGPGASATLLHFGVAGPRLGEGDRLVDNPDTWLVDTDLVFVDPIGAGFSRPTRPEYGQEFYGTVGDVNSVTAFVRAWLGRHHSRQAPVYLVGESWGAGRAGSVGYAAAKSGVRLRGLVLISGGDGLHEVYAPSSLTTALHVAELAATAHFHGRTPATMGRDVEAVRAEAEAWARRVYAPALADVASLSDAQRTEIVAELSRYTGLPIDMIDPKTLSVTPRQFRSGLLKDEGKTLNTFDMRLTSEPTDAAAPAILRYLRGELGYHTDLPYIDLEPAETAFGESVNERWNYATISVSPEVMAAAIDAASKRGGGPPVIGPPLPSTAEAVALDPGLKVIVAAGLYDSLNSCAANAEKGRRLPPLLAKAIVYKCYVGGHMIYRDPAARHQLSADVRDLIRGR